jgi:hypothetical protein
LQDLAIRRRGVVSPVARDWLDEEASHDPEEIRAAFAEMANHHLSEKPRLLDRLHSGKCQNPFLALGFYDALAGVAKLATPPTDPMSFALLARLRHALGVMYGAVQLGRAGSWQKGGFPQGQCESKWEMGWRLRITTIPDCNNRATRPILLLIPPHL